MIKKFKKASMKYLVIAILTVSSSNYANAKNPESNFAICDAAEINLCKESTDQILKTMTDCKALNYKKYQSIKYKLLALSIYSNDSSCLKNLNDTGLLTKSDFNKPITVSDRSPLRIQMPEYKYNVMPPESPLNYFNEFMPSLHLSSLGHAIYLNNVTMAKTLVSMGASLDITTPVYRYATDGKPLTYFNIDLYGVAALVNNMEALQFLKNTGANINNKNALSPIFLTIFSTSLQPSFEFLVKNGINVNNTAYGFDIDGYVKNGIQTEVYLEKNYSPRHFISRIFERNNWIIEGTKKLLEQSPSEHHGHYQKIIHGLEERQIYYQYLSKQLQDAGAAH